LFPFSKIRPHLGSAASKKIAVFSFNSENGSVYHLIFLLAGSQDTSKVCYLFYHC
jgi:hypothetical protein